MTDKGKLYGVSLGPGDPGLITRRAWTLLQRDDVHWTYPVRGEGHESFALSIARAAGLAVPVASGALVFPMTHDKARLKAAWTLAAERVLPLLRRGTDVLFLAEGDTSTYSSFGYLADAVSALDPEIAVEAVAGVTSFHAAAARLGVPLVDLDNRMAVLPAGYGIAVIDHLLDEHDTLVLLKVKPLLDDLIDLLRERGLLAHSAFVEKIGTPEERVVRDLTSLRNTKVNYLSLVLVKNPRRARGPMIRGCRRKPGGSGSGRSRSGGCCVEKSSS